MDENNIFEKENNVIDVAQEELKEVKPDRNPYSVYGNPTEYSNPLNQNAEYVSHYGQSSTDAAANYAETAENNGDVSEIHADTVAGSAAASESYVETAAGNNDAAGSYTGTAAGGNEAAGGYNETSRGYEYTYPEAYRENSYLDEPKKVKKSGAFGRFMGNLGKVVAFSIVAAICFFATNKALYYYFPDQKASAEESTAKPADNGDKLVISTSADKSQQVAQANGISTVDLSATDVSQVVDNCMPSIVSINATFTVSSFFGSYETPGAGSGIILRQTEDELFIATNNHVVDGGKDIKVTFSDGAEVLATIKGRDAVADLAVLSIQLADIEKDTLETIKVASLGSSDDMKVGEMVVAIGNALGYGQSTTVGYVSAKDREVNVDGTTMNLLQTDAAINPGNSGGALINLRGEVIGINSIKYADAKVEGMGFAIPINYAYDILNEIASRELLADSEKGYLGVYITDVTDTFAQIYNWPVGIYISQIVEGGAAEAAGLQSGDIITAINGATVKTSDQFKEKVSSLRAGTEISITFQRMNEGKFEEYTRTAVLGQNPDAK